MLEIALTWPQTKRPTDVLMNTCQPISTIGRDERASFALISRAAGIY